MNKGKVFLNNDLHDPSEFLGAFGQLSEFNGARYEGFLKILLYRCELRGPEPIYNPFKVDGRIIGAEKPESHVSDNYSDMGWHIDIDFSNETLHIKKGPADTRMEGMVAVKPIDYSGEGEREYKILAGIFSPKGKAIRAFRCDVPDSRLITMVDGLICGIGEAYLTPGFTNIGEIIDLQKKYLRIPEEEFRERYRKIRIKYREVA